MLHSSYKSQVIELFKSIKVDDEFEVMFNNYKSSNMLSLVNFINIMKYVKYRSQNESLPLSESISLDIFYNEYRFSITGLDNINKFLGLVYQRKNNHIISLLVEQYLDKEGFHLIKKEKERANIIDIDSLDIRIRKSKETSVKDNNVLDMLSKLNAEESTKIIFRYKQRLTLALSDNIMIDMTIVKTNQNISFIYSSPKIYEIEIDYTGTNTNITILDKILDETEKIKKVLTGSDIVLTNEMEAHIIEKYKLLTFGNINDNTTMLYSSQPISAEVQHIVDNIPNKYSVTDKADGDKYQLFIYEDSCYLISNNLHVKKLEQKVKNINNTIVEGELITITEDNKRKYLFMMFDCLIYNGIDIRNKVLVRERLKSVAEVSEKFGINPYIVEDYKGPFNMIDIKKHYIAEIKKYYDNLNVAIKKMKFNDVLFYPKIFLYPSGSSPSEVFLFSDLIWLNCTKNTNVNCPYLLDGIIFTGLDQKYTREKKELRLPIYKYKPPQMNSLDVYLVFERNKETGGYMDIYDNTIQNILPFHSYRVANIFVGEMIGGKEQPVPFMKEQENNIIYLPIIDNMIRDINGNLVQDKTVVELIYTNNINVPHPYRWDILKTRWDKTESVMRDNKRYGNYKDVAEKVWKSMIEAVTIDEITNLSNPKTYEQQMKLLRSRLTSSVIISEKKQDIYYQKISNLIKKMREYHNWIKSIIIYTYCSPIQDKKGGKIIRQSVLDIGCGRGGDILKMYHAKVGEYVGIDPDFEGIYSATDGAISRYKFFKTKFPDFGKVTYIQAYGSVLLNSDAQQKAIPNLSAENKEAIDKIFTNTRKFDNISSQMVIHYLFENTTTINNLVENIKTFLAKDGYVLLTLFDPDTIHPNFDANNKITSTYTDKDGKRTILYEIIKKYSGDLSNNVGMPIDVHMAWLNEEGKYIEEYLVSKELMIKTMKRAGCRLVDTDLFANIYQLNKPYFENVIKYEENPKNKQFYEKIAEFFGDLNGADKESKAYSFMFRYYIFQKME